MKTEIQETELYKKFKKALNIHDMRSDDNPFVVECCKIAEQYAGEYKQALWNIANPIKYLQNELKDGEQLNGGYAIQLSNDASFLKDMAKKALLIRDSGVEGSDTTGKHSKENDDQQKLKP